MFCLLLEMVYGLSVISDCVGCDLLLFVLVTQSEDLMLTYCRVLRPLDTRHSIRPRVVILLINIFVQLKGNHCVIELLTKLTPMVRNLRFYSWKAMLCCILFTVCGLGDR